MNPEVRKSKIYSYFYGAGTAFQQFIVIVGILFIMLGFASTQARYIKMNNTYEKYNKLNDEAEVLYDEYYKLFSEYTYDEKYNFNCKLNVEAEIVEGDKNAAEKEAYNKALNDYNDAEAKAAAAKKSYEASAPYKAASTLKSTYDRIYRSYRYRFTVTQYEMVTINENDLYATEKAEHNEALKAYNDAVKAAEATDTYKNYAQLAKNADDLKAAYEKLYNDYTTTDICRFVCTIDEAAEIAENDKFKEEKENLNNKLASYTDSQAKADKVYEKYINMRNSNSSPVLYMILGVIAILAGLIWSLIKKNSFDKKSCEEAYDEELSVRIEDAKVKAMEKLNIVAEQIDMVEPVVLNGVATIEASVAKKSAGKIANFMNTLSYIGGIILGSLVTGLYSLIASRFGGAFFIPVLVAIALAGFLGFKFYNKYEKESYVNPKKIDKLEKFNPNLITKLGTDEAIRVSLPAITVYMFGAEQIYMYYQYLDIVTGKIFCEGIHEYFYEDVVGVVSSQETKKVFKPTGFLKLSFKVIEYLRESITVVTSGCQHAEAYIVPMGNSLLDTSFVGMRNLIRQKKNDDE